MPIPRLTRILLLLSLFVFDNFSKVLIHLNCTRNRQLFPLLGGCSFYCRALWPPSLARHTFRFLLCTSCLRCRLFSWFVLDNFASRFGRCLLQPFIFHVLALDFPTFRFLPRTPYLGCRLFSFFALRQTRHLVRPLHEFLAWVHHVNVFLQIREDESLRGRQVGRRRFQVGRVKNFLNFARVIRVSDEVGETIQDRRDKLAGFSRPTSKLVTGFAHSFIVPVSTLSHCLSHACEVASRHSSTSINNRFAGELCNALNPSSFALYKWSLWEPCCAIVTHDIERGLFFRLGNICSFRQRRFFSFFLCRRCLFFFQCRRVFFFHRRHFFHRRRLFFIIRPHFIFCRYIIVVV